MIIILIIKRHSARGRIVAIDCAKYTRATNAPEDRATIFSAPRHHRSRKYAHSFRYLSRHPWYCSIKVASRSQHPSSKWSRSATSRRRRRMSAVNMQYSRWLLANGPASHRSCAQHTSSAKLCTLARTIATDIAKLSHGSRHAIGMVLRHLDRSCNE